MAVAKKKAPAKKQAAEKTSKQTTSKLSVKARVEVRKKSAKNSIDVKAKPVPKAGIESKAKANKIIAKPPKEKTVPNNKSAGLKSERKDSAAGKPAVSKKSSAAAAPAAERFRGLKGMLITKRNVLLKEAKQEIQKYVSGENRQLVDTAIDEADWAAVEISEDINLKRLSAQRQLLKDVEECLRKLDEGTYGICEDCNEEISEKRLKVIPTATLCIDCKELREKMAIMDQDTEI